MHFFGVWPKPLQINLQCGKIFDGEMFYEDQKLLAKTQSEMLITLPTAPL